MTLSEVAQRRLVNQHLTGSKLAPLKLLEWFAAVQAQEYAPAKWGLGCRLPETADADLEQLFTDGKILRTHLMRPTWHFVSARDIGWMLELTAPRVHAANAYMYRQLKLDAAEFRICDKLISRALERERYLTREAINEVLKKKGIVAHGHRLSYIMMHAELEGLICSGPRDGNQFTYTLLGDRVKKPKKLMRDEALAELAKRYFSSRGPATIKDFSTWSGLSLIDCRKAVSAMEVRLQKTSIDGRDYYFDRASPADIKPDKKILLLPTYDEFIMGYRDRSAIFQLQKSLKPKAGARFASMVVQGGQVIGTWRRTLEKNTIMAQFHFFETLNNERQKELQVALKRLETFSDLPVKVM